jgi:hypothetical protein
MKIRRFPSGAVRSDDTGRIRPDYLSPYALKYIAECFSNNSNDFGATNYFKGIKPDSVFESLYRHHLDLHESLIEGDKDAIKRQYASLAQNCIMALHQIIMEEKGLYKEVHEKTELVDKEVALSGVVDTVNLSGWKFSTTGTSSTKYYCQFTPSIANAGLCAICGKSLVYHQTK